MANEEHLEILRAGVEVWNKWRQKSNITPDLRDLSANEADYRGIYFNGVDLAGAVFINVDLREANLHQANLSGATLIGTNLSSASLGQAKLNKAILVKTDLTRADLTGADLVGASLSSVDLTKANLDYASMTNSKWAEVKLNASTNLKKIRFTTKHRPLEDGTDNLDIPWSLRFLQWSFIRNIGQLPLFGVSWIGLITSLLVLNNLGWWNNSFARQILLFAGGTGPIPGHLTLEIPIPERLVLTVVDALLLVIGSTLYKFACPRRIQTFTEVEWVEQYGHPRLLYLAESFGHPIHRVVTLVFLMAGGLLALYLIGESIIAATQYARPVIVQWLWR
jgi:hypothetical protein